MFVKVLRDNEVKKVVSNIKFVELRDNKPNINEYCIEVKQNGEQYSVYYNRKEVDTQVIVYSDEGIELQTLHLTRKEE